MPSKKRPLRWPALEAIADALRAVNATAQPSGPTAEGEDVSIDVRLQVYPDGNWAIRWGDSQSDLDHRGYWGAASVPGWNHRFPARETARELRDQAQEMHATGEAKGEDDE